MLVSERILRDPTAGSFISIIETEYAHIHDTYDGTRPTGQSARDQELKSGIHHSHLSMAGSFSTVEPSGEECVC